MITRRSCVSSILGGGAIGLILITEVLAQTAPAVGIKWTISRSDLEALGDSLQFDGQKTPDESKGKDSRGLPLLYILVGTIVLPHLAEVLLTLYQRLGPGVVVQDSDAGLIIARDPAVPSDMMILKGKDGLQIKAIRQIPNSSVILDMLKMIPLPVGTH